MFESDTEVLRHLRARLEELAQPGRYGPDGRILVDSGDSSVLAALVREIDETILPRLLHFNCDGREIALEVADRRVLRLVADDDEVVAQMGWTDKVEAEDGGKFAEWLVSFCKRAERLAVRTEAPEETRAASSDGVSARALQQIIKNGDCMLSYDEACVQSVALVEGAINASGEVQRSPSSSEALNCLNARREASTGEPARLHFEAWHEESVGHWWMARAGTGEASQWYIFDPKALTQLAQIWARAEKR